MRTPKSTAQAMQEQIADRLHVPARVFWTGETSSTNDDARRAALAGEPALAVFGAERQHAGRGRLERHWETGAGDAVEMSFLLRPAVAGAALAGFNFAAALGISEGLEACSGIETKIKWPNDVLADGAKICGILSEASLLGDRTEFVVTGTGINVNQLSFPESLRGAVSLRMLTGAVQPRAVVAAACIDAVAKWAAIFEAGGFDAIMEAYRERSAVLGQEVDVIGRDGTVTGCCTGFDDDGAIIVSVGSGLQRFHASDVSVRGAGLHV